MPDNPGAVALEKAMAMFPTAVVSVRYSGEDKKMAATVTTAMCTGLDRVREQTDQGLYDGATGYVRYLKVDEPTAWGKDDAINGCVVEVLFYGATTWRRLRIMGRLEMQGAVKLTVAAEYAE